MPTITFAEGTDPHAAVSAFGDADGVSEDDLLAALQLIESWYQRFTESYTFEHEGRQITLYHHYESLVWALGESFRRIMLRNRRLRRRERIFEAVRVVCLDQRLGKGRESFTMLLGQYGGAAQIPTLIRLLDDPDVSGHAVYALRLLGASEAAERIGPFLDSPKTWVRREARKYFEKIASDA